MYIDIGCLIFICFFVIFLEAIGHSIAEKSQQQKKDEKNIEP